MAEFFPSENLFGKRTSREVSLIIGHLFGVPQAKPKINYIDENCTSDQFHFIVPKEMEWMQFNYIFVLITHCFSEEILLNKALGSDVRCSFVEE